MIKLKNKNYIEVLIKSIVTDNSRDRWLKSDLVDSSDIKILKQIEDCYNAIGDPPLAFIYANNNLFRKWYSICDVNHLPRARLSYIFYQVSVTYSIPTGKRTILLFYLDETHLEWTILPNKTLDLPQYV